MSVDFPDPDGPMMATSSPASIVTDTPRSAWTTCAPSRYSFTRLCVSMTGSAISSVWRKMRAAADRREFKRIRSPA